MTHCKDSLFKTFAQPDHSCSSTLPISLKQGTMSEIVDLLDAFDWWMEQKSSYHFNTPTSLIWYFHLVKFKLITTKSTVNVEWCLNIHEFWERILIKIHSHWNDVITKHS